MPNLAENPATLVVGCGYLGRRVARRLLKSGHFVWGVTRSQSHAERFKLAGIEPILADWTDRGTLCDLPAVSQILVAVSYDRSSPYDRHTAQVVGLENLLDATPPQTNLCYISTTGVYHQQRGEWVDENSPCRPLTDGGRIHLAAEETLRQTRPDSPWTILRLAGIYGPGRVPRVDDVLAGRPIASPQDGYLNLIHVDDAAAAVTGAWNQAQQRIYLISDDRPVLRREFYREVAGQYGAPEPQFVEPAADAPVRQRAASNKRIRNAAMKRDLLPKLQFPTFVEGLTDCLSADDGD